MELLQVLELYFWPFFTVVVTVLAVIGIKHFGNIPRPVSGPAFNLLTYGFLWDSTIRAVRHETYWPNYEQVLFFNRDSILLIISLVNLGFLAWNFKVDAWIEGTDAGKRLRLGLLKTLSLSLGTVSLLFFLYCKANWG